MTDTERHDRETSQRYGASRLLAMFALLLSLCVPPVAIWVGASDLLNRKNHYRGTNQEWSEVTAKLESLEQSVTNLYAVIADMRSGPDDAKFALILSTMQVELQQLSDEQAVIETALGENPTRVLSIPLLRKDVESIKSRQNDVMNDVRQQIDRIYDQNKWFLALMVTTAVAVIGLAAGILYQEGKKKTSPNN